VFDIDLDLVEHHAAVRTGSGRVERLSLESPVATFFTELMGALERAGVRLAFGSDAPVETADPLAGMAAATTWRKEAKWHPELALTRAAALRAYTSDAAFAAGMEDDLGALRPGKLCDITVIHEGKVEATVAGGRLTFRRKRA